MKRLLVLSSIGLVASAIAGVLVKETHSYNLRERDGRVIAQELSFADCKLAARALFDSRKVPTQEFLCIDRASLAFTGDCSDVPAPVLVPKTDIVIEKNPSRYADDKPEPGTIYLPDGSAQHTFTDVGTLTSRLCPNGVDYELSDTKLVNDPATFPYPQCWGEKQVVTFACPTP